MSARKKLRRFDAVTVGVSRLIVAACFIFSGFVKAVDPVGTQLKLADYIAAFGMAEIPADISLMAACVLAGFEFLLGVYLLFGVFERGTLWMLAIAVLSFTSLTLYLALKNPVSDCGCFGDALVLTNWQTFVKNVFILLLTLHIILLRRYIRPLIHARLEWLMPVITVLLIGNFMLTNIRDLPIFDFRPYRIGTDLRSAVYEGKDNSYADFFLMDGNMNDVTDMLLDDGGYTFLVVSPHIENASQSNIDMINDLYYYCCDAGYPMYGVTSSGRNEVGRWRDMTYAEYDFLHADDILLKTMIRSDPGIVVLKDGVIEHKWSDSGIPIDSQRSCRMEQMRRKYPALSDGRVVLTLTVLYFMLPYLLLIAIDRLLEREWRSRRNSNKRTLNNN